MILQVIVASLRAFPRIAAALAISVVIITCSERKPLLQGSPAERRAARDERLSRQHPCESSLPSCYLASTLAE